MDFRSYRKQQGWTLKEAADFLSNSDLTFTASMVRKHEIGQNFPRAPLIERYRQLTGGKVTATDFVEARNRFLREQQAEAAA